MTELTPDEAMARARQAVGAPAALKAKVWRVIRLDRAGEAYYLVVFGEDHAAVAVVAISAERGVVMNSARLDGVRPHLAIDSARAQQIAKLEDASAELVWQPCRASLSPLYPFWRVTTATRVAYVDQQEKCWDRLSSARA